jgi:hypothetical protein
LRRSAGLSGREQRLRIAVANRALGFAVAGSLLLLAVLASSRAVAQPAGAQRGAGSDRYFIEFRSRPSTYIGHTYIFFGRTDASGRILDARYAGFIPEVDAVQALIVPVEGTVRKYEDDVRLKPNAIYGRSLTAAEYAAVVRAVRILKQSQRKWHPIFQNCNDFGIGIAEALGMRRPHSLMPPSVWVATLRMLNER